MRTNKLLTLGFVIVAIATLILFTSSCAQAPNAILHTTNNRFELARLFTSEGCTVYRFYDTVEYHYFTKCQDTSNVETSSDQSCGKNCVRQDNIVTSNAN